MACFLKSEENGAPLSTKKISIDDLEISKRIIENVDLTPFGIEKRFKLKMPIYTETASYGHFGRYSKTKIKDFSYLKNNINQINVELFPWEKLDYVDLLSQILLHK